MDLQPQVDLELRANVAVVASWLWFWRTELGDGIYGVSGRLVRSGAGSAAHFVGYSPGVRLQWQIDRRVALRTEWSMFTAGPFIRDTGPHRDSSFVLVSTIYRFEGTP